MSSASSTKKPQNTDIVSKNGSTYSTRTHLESKGIPICVTSEVDKNDPKLDDEMTTIQISIRSKKKLDSLKNHTQETYDDMINRLIRIVEEEEANLTDQDIKNIERSLEKIKQGKFVPL